MSKNTRDIETFISEDLHSLLFLEEFIFAKSRSVLQEQSELELADAVVLLGDTLLVYQFKERAVRGPSDAAAEGRWFNSKILGKAKKQMSDTVRYLSTNQEIKIPNQRGRIFNLAGRPFKRIIKVIGYISAQPMSLDCRSTKCYVSEVAGFIHIVDLRDYLEIARTLRVPQEVVKYFEYREAVLT